jgi:hypothetical protein
MTDTTSDHKLSDVFDVTKNFLQQRRLKAEVNAQHKEQQAKLSAEHKTNIEKIDKEFADASKQWKIAKPLLINHLNKCLQNLKIDDKVVCLEPNSSIWRQTKVKAIDKELDEDGDQEWNLVLVDDNQREIYRRVWRYNEKEKQDILLLPLAATNGDLALAKIVVKMLRAELKPVLFV